MFNLYGTRFWEQNVVNETDNWDWNVSYAWFIHIYLN